jgi:NhaP-type Na+/H+ or K+/H+ antiporter
VFLNAIRFALTFSFYPVLSRIGLKSNLSEATFISFGGLRGAVGIALALSLEAEVLQATNEGSEYQLWVTTLFGMVGGVSFLTLLINGSLAGPLLIKLGLAESTAIRKRVVEHFRIAAKENVIHTLIKLLADPRFDHVDMTVIFHHVPILKVRRT